MQTKSVKRGRSQSQSRAFADKPSNERSYSKSSGKTFIGESIIFLVLHSRLRGLHCPMVPAWVNSYGHTDQTFRH